jgi:hypothetical protein
MRLLKPKNILIYLVICLSIIGCNKDLDNLKPNDGENHPVSLDPTSLMRLVPNNLLFLGNKKITHFLLKT